MEQMNNSTNSGSGGEESPNPNHGGMNFNFNDGPSTSTSFAGGQMINPMAFMAQFPGMMGNMPNNPQGMMNMMGAYCQTASGGNMGMGGFGGGGGFPDGGPTSQGMNPQAMAAQMMRKRAMDDDEGQPYAKRAIFDPSAGDVSAVKTEEEGGNVNRSSNSSTGDQDEKPSSDSPGPRKEHVAVPPSKEGIKFYSRNDVLCGRGGGTNVHPGNRRFRDLINANRRAYLKARKNDKPAISRSIVRTIREMNGRFLKKDEKQGLWFEIGDDGAREKTSQALRQRAPEMRKILFEDEQRSQHQQQQEMMQRHQLMGMGQGGMPGMGGNFQMGQSVGGGNMANFAAMSGSQGGNGGGGNNDLSQSLLAKYNMLHQKNWLAQEKNMILQRLAMSGINPNSLSGGQNDNISNISTQTLLQQGMKPVTPRGA